jgi:CubicO group peptidase (beta-lactamase class C family)
MSHSIVTRHKKANRIHYFVTILLIISILITAGCSTYPYGVPTTGGWMREDVDPHIRSVVNEFRTSVPKIMKRDKISGCALALVDSKGILWSEGFGTTDFKRRIPVTPDTLFNIGSISKTFTASAVLLAVQDSLLELDEPIVTYLPDFKVYSRYEERPEGKITLRHLLGHTSGLPHEAVGCNALEVGGTFEDRVKGINGLWLKCPVGKAYSYSGAGYDLAAYVLQTISGIPFEQYVTERIFRPLGMFNSTLDQNDISRNTNRSVGQMIGIAEHPTAHGLLGAGGVWTSAKDLSHFIQCFINGKSGEENLLLSKSLMDVMFTPRAFTPSPEKEKWYYGLGIHISQSFGEIEMHHRGAGCGYTSLIHWSVKYGIGGLYLTNRIPLRSFDDLAIGRKLIWEGRLEKKFPESELDFESCVPEWNVWPNHAPSSYQPEWKQYCGTYRLQFSGYKLKWWAKLASALDPDQYSLRIKVFEKNGYLCLTDSQLLGLMYDRQVDSRLMEVKSGVFYTASGDVLNFSGKNPTWRSYRLEKQ